MRLRVHMYPQLSYLIRDTRKVSNLDAMVKQEDTPASVELCMRMIYMACSSFKTGLQI